MESQSNFFRIDRTQSIDQIPCIECNREFFTRIVDVEIFLCLSEIRILGGKAELTFFQVEFDGMTAFCGEKNDSQVNCQYSKLTFSSSFR